MLQTQAVADSTLELLKKLQSKDYLGEFYLAGGTALALYWGHRQSIDLDLFTSHDFDPVSLLDQIQQDFDLQLLFTSTNTIKGYINGVNVDFIAHKYPLLQVPYHEKGMRILSEEDILAMKLNAVSVSGQRAKDFVDIFFGLNNHSLAQMVGYYQEKYDQKQASHVMKSLVYFDEVDLADWPVMLKQPDLKWDEVKTRIEKAVIN